MRKDTEKTRNSLLAAAIDIFSEKGYRDATIAEICERAKTNIASVNYHFKDKETLYREAWRYAFLGSIKTHPPDNGVSPDAPPEARLKGLVIALLRRIDDKNNKEFLIVHKELANPTGLLEEVINEELGPLRERMRTVVLDLFGADFSETQVLFCVTSIVGQCIIPMLIKRAKNLQGDEKSDPRIINDIDTYADHVVVFSLAGIRASKMHVENNLKGGFA